MSFQRFRSRIHAAIRTLAKLRRDSGNDGPPAQFTRVLVESRGDVDALRILKSQLPEQDGRDNMVLRLPPLGLPEGRTPTVTELLEAIERHEPGTKAKVQAARTSPGRPKNPYGDDDDALEND